MARRILCISLTPIHRDARVLRQIKLLSEFGEVTTIGFGDRPDNVTEHIQVPDGLATLPQTIPGVLKLALRLHRSAEGSSPAARFVANHDVPRGWDLVVANDARVLDLAFSVAAGAPVWADLHEWAPEERTHILSWRILVAPFMTYLSRKYLNRAALVTTVSQGIVDLYREHFGVNALMMTNAGPLQDIPVRESQSDRVACVHSGAAIGGRGLETMIEVVSQLPERFTLDLYLVPGGDNGAHLRELQKRAAACTRIRFCTPVTPGELPQTLSKYDLGLFWIPPTHTNARLTLPNKFFDYVQARIGIAIGPSEEMVRELRAYSLGVVSNSFELDDLVSSLQNLDAVEINSFKHAADRAAHDLSFSAQSVPVRKALESVFMSTGGRT